MSSQYDRRGPFTGGRSQGGGIRGGPTPAQPRDGSASALNEEETRKLEQVICQGDARTIIGWADSLGQQLVAGYLTTSQIRNVYGTVKQIQLSWEQNPTQAFREAILLIPKIHYQVARQAGKKGSQGLQSFESVMVPALELLAKS
ncbi:MAG: type III-A CRISPR-associated protein Csm2, partial [Chloroflexi bacterium]|nr:type III-A CRISPR-associated protein Csm2 [Chloroflexota bacterium]